MSDQNLPTKHNFQYYDISNKQVSFRISYGQQSLFDCEWSQVTNRKSLKLKDLAFKFNINQENCNV